VQSKRPLVPPGLPLTSDQQDVVDTFRVLATLPADSLGAYIISMAQTASDVLIVVLLQRELGINQLLRVVPLFETLDDLKNAPETMRKLFSNEWYAKHIAGLQECMIGYSDSGKDAGRLAAAWALYEAQETLTALASEFGASSAFRRTSFSKCDLRTMWQLVNSGVPLFWIRNCELREIK
jgi:phosphoenolpyruvate carboxylase